MAGDSKPVSSDEIEELLRQAQAAATSQPTAEANAIPTQSAERPATAAASKAGTGGTKAATQAPAVARPTGSAPRATSSSQTANDAQFLLAQAEAALASVDHPVDSAIQSISPFQFPELSGSPASTERATLDLLSDVELDLRIELGRAHMHLEEVLKLRRGAVVTLDKLAGDPVDIYVNGRLVARGEVLVLNDNFCVRVAELLSGSEAA